LENEKDIWKKIFWKTHLEKDIWEKDIWKNEFRTICTGYYFLLFLATKIRRFGSSKQLRLTDKRNFTFPLFLQTRKSFRRFLQTRKPFHRFLQTCKSFRRFLQTRNYFHSFYRLIIYYLSII
jgi:hypothetical protein